MGHKRNVGPLIRNSVPLIRKNLPPEARKAGDANRGDREYEMSNDADGAVTRGATNVFADLGRPDAVERQTKTRLAKQVNELLGERRLKQVEAGRVLGVPRSKVSALAHYRLDGFSVEKLMGFLTLRDQDVEILIRPRRDAPSRGRVLFTPFAE